MKFIIEDAKPQVGIFELIDNVLLYDSIDMNVADVVGGAVDAGRLFHADLVKQAMYIPQISDKTKEELKKYHFQNWRKWPRGRVWYKVDTDKFYISSCREFLTNSRLVQDVMRKFSLPQNKVVLVVDAFYSL